VPQAALACRDLTDVAHVTVLPPKPYLSWDNCAL
jgi:hypothetical protein